MRITRIVSRGARYIRERGQGQYKRIRRSIVSQLFLEMKRVLIRDKIFILSFIIQEIENRACNSLSTIRQKRNRWNINLFNLCATRGLRMTLN